MDSTGVTSTQVSPFDLIPPKVYIKFAIYLSLNEDASHDQVFDNLHAALCATFDQIPFLSGTVHLRSPKAHDWRPGQLEIRHESRQGRTGNRTQSTPLRHLTRKDLSSALDGLGYDDLRDAGFPFSSIDDDLLISAPFIPDVAAGADVFIAQANFLRGGCLLAGAIHHAVADGTGMMLLMQAWAANCKALVVGDATTPPPPLAQRLDATTYDRNVLERVWRKTGVKIVEEVDRNRWYLLGLDPPTSTDVGGWRDSAEKSVKAALFALVEAFPVLYSWYALLLKLLVLIWYPALRRSHGGHDRHEKISKTESNHVVSGRNTTPLAVGTITTPPTTANTESPKRKAEMKSSIFYMTAKSFAQLKKDMAGTSDICESISANDALLALFWRSLMKARINAVHAVPLQPGEDALLQSPIDGRAAFSDQVPRLYLGNVVLINQVYMAVADLTRPSTALRDVALRVRQGALKINHESVHDAFTLAAHVQDYTTLKHAFTSLEGSAMMITSLIALPFEDFNFGDRLFGNGGKPDNLRPLMGGFNRAFRLCVVLPWKAHGGLELLVSLFEDEMDVLMEDEEFNKYASFLCD